MKNGAKVAVENVIRPGKSTQLDAEKYGAMRTAILRILPEAAPGMTVAQVQQGVLAHLPQTLFPGGARSGWWMKAVQLDLEAKRIIAREKVSPLRLHKTGS